MPDKGIKFQGEFAVAGGGTSEAVTVPGLTAVDPVSVTLYGQANDSYIANIVVTDNTLTLTFNTDPGAAKISVIAIR